MRFKTKATIVEQGEEAPCLLFPDCSGLFPEVQLLLPFLLASLLGMAVAQ